MKIRVVQFQQGGSGRSGSVVVEAGGEIVSSEVSIEALSNDSVIQEWCFNSRRLQELMATFGFLRELQEDCRVAFRGSPRPLPWDYGDFPDGTEGESEGTQTGHS